MRMRSGNNDNGKWRDIGGDCRVVRSNALLFCPFCKSGNVRTVSTAIKYERETYDRVKCDNCGAYGPIARNKEDARKYWTQRAK